MKALLLEAEYEPKQGRRSDCSAGSDIWRYPRLSVAEVSDPSLTADDDVIVRVRVTGICGSDVHCVESDEEGYIRFSGPAVLPRVLGHELSGEIAAVGPAVKKLRVGQAVAAESIEACFSCGRCRAGHLNVCENVQLIGLTLDGSFGPYVRLRAGHVYPIDSIIKTHGTDEGFELASLLEPVGVAYNAILKSPVGPGDRVVVFGAGPIGLGIVALSKMFGATVHVFDLMEERVRLASNMGADTSINIGNLSTDVTPSRVVSDLGGGLATKVFDATGDARIFSFGLDCLAGKGDLVYVGRTSRAVSFDSNVIVSKELRVIGSRGHAGYNIFPTLIEWIGGGRLDLAPMITARYPFSRVLQAFEQAKLQVDGKIVVKAD